MTKAFFTSLSGDPDRVTHRKATRFRQCPPKVQAQLTSKDVLYRAAVHREIRQLRSERQLKYRSISVRAISWESFSRNFRR
jgi:hypothetical protein